MPVSIGLTDKGLVRNANQDAFLIRNDLGLYLLADGMGGARGGETAARLALEAAEAVVESGGTLSDAFLAAHERVQTHAGKHPSCRGMGTTLVAARVVADGVELSSVGDSRAYLFEHGLLGRLTRDQSWVEDVGRALGLSDEALKNHPFRHVITMAIGVDAPLAIRSSRLEPGPGSILLLSSDGLHGPVEESRIEKILFEKRELPARAHSLIEAAKAAGAPDNVTVVLVEL